MEQAGSSVESLLSTHLKQFLEDLEDIVSRDDASPETMDDSDSDSDDGCVSDDNTSNNFNIPPNFSFKELKEKNLIIPGMLEAVNPQLSKENEEQDEADSSDSEDESVEEEDTDIILRGYQWELARPALTGKNVIICAPTNSGKTRVALRVIQEHMRRLRGKVIPKVIFIVNQVELANQQGKNQIREYLRHYRSKIFVGSSAGSSVMPLNEYLKSLDICVVTAQIFLNALVKGENKITDFTLMIFDECHHTHSNEPFNRIMQFYMDLKLSGGAMGVQLPQVIGLTATLGAGKSNSDEGAVTHMTKLMANLDAKELCTVRDTKNLAELSDYVSETREKIELVSKRQNNLFEDCVTEVMKTIERMMTSSPLNKGVRMPLDPPPNKGSEQYIGWLSSVEQNIVILCHDRNVRRFFNTCRLHLKFYNDCLIIYKDARVKDAVACLEKDMDVWKERLKKMISTEKILLQIANCLSPYDFQQTSENPKLMKLQEVIVRNCLGRNMDNCRAIVFVKTRKLAGVLVQWLKETSGLDALNAVEFVGSNARGGKGGITKHMQVDVMKLFKGGEHKLIVATSIGEEGLDIAKCNLVVCYDHVTNEIARIQARGRGRAVGSKFYIIAEHRSGTVEKTELNAMLEKRMENAVKVLQSEIEQNEEVFLQKLAKLQQMNKDAREADVQKRKELAATDQLFELRCKHCEDFICMSSDVRKVETNYTAVNDDFRKNVEFRLAPPWEWQVFRSSALAGKIYCKGCGEDLGPISVFQNLDYGIIKSAALLIVDSMGVRIPPKKQWKKVPFVVKPIEAEEKRRMAEMQLKHLQNDD